MSFSKYGQILQRNILSKVETYWFWISTIFDQQTSNTVFDNYSGEAYRLQNLNAAWDEPTEYQAPTFSHISHTDGNGVTNPLENGASYRTNKTEYEEENNTFSPMTGFVSSLLSRYEVNAATSSEVPNDGNISGDDDEFQCSDEMQGQGFCSVKSDFNPNTFQYKSTPGLLKITKGESLLILQNDLGSGWTCVRNPNNSQTGFVPTRNLNISWYHYYTTSNWISFF